MIVHPVFVVVLKTIDRIDDVVAHQAFVYAAWSRGRGIDEITSAVPEPAVQVELHGQRSGHAGLHHDRWIERQLLLDVEVAREGEISAVEGSLYADADAGEIGMCHEKRLIRRIPVRDLVNLELEFVERAGRHDGGEHPGRPAEGQVDEERPRFDLLVLIPTLPA